MSRRGPILLFLLAFVAVGFPLRGVATESASPVSQDRAVEPVVLTGAQLPGWSAGSEISAREPTQPINSDCTDDQGDGLSHNCSEPSRIPNNPNVGAAVERLLGYRWDGGTGAFEPIPFQVDERFTRYISNLASNCSEAGPFCIGFGAYAGADAQLSYVYDRDSYKFTEGTCTAEMKPGDGPEADPVKGLDDNDELAFLYRDAGPQAPPDAALPEGVSEIRKIRVDDPSAPDSQAQYAYIGLASESVNPPFNASNGYMRYVRDADADRYEKTSDNYGNAPAGPVCDAAGNVIQSNVARRPRDTAWVLTPRYAFRYAGRWILRGVRVAPGDRDQPLAAPSDYGPPLVDQWKARAYAQRPEDETPCCGFETEQDSWGGSSVTLGERSGPVRVIRTTWGSDSGTNTVRNELFYPDLIVQQTNLRVHPIPPLGGIFSYWDHTAGVVTKYYNPQRPEGVDVDGRNDEVVGTTYVAARPGGVEVRDDDPIPVIGPQTVAIGSQDGCLGECTDFDVPDPTLQAAGTLTWEQVGGPFGSMVFKTRLNQVSPGNAQSLATLPYYRDDACFDDGTGIDPGPHTNPKNPDPERPCWTPDQPAPDPRFRQGLIGAHGVQVMFAAETDNLMLTVPTTEISAETRMVVLPGDPGNVGERYAHASDVPLQATAVDAPAIDPTTIAVTGDTSGRIGDPARFAATLSDAIGPVANAPLHFGFEGKSYEATTDAQGNAAVTGVPVAGPAGTTDLVVTYDGDGLLRSPSSKRAGFEVNKENVSISFAPTSASSGKIADQATFIAKLQAATGPIAGSTLHFDVQGATYDATTGADGLASVSVVLKAPAGESVVNARSDETSTRSAGSASAPFTVTKRNSKISFTATSVPAGRVVVDARLIDSDTSTGLANRAVSVLVDGKTMATVTTDGGGRAIATFKYANPRNKLFRVEFASDDTYLACSAQAVFTGKGASG